MNVFMNVIDTIILLFSSKQVQNSISLKNTSIKIISCSNDIIPALKEKNVEFSILGDYYSSPINYSEFTREWMDNWVYYKDGTKYAFLDVFSSDIGNLWWYIDIEVSNLLGSLVRTISEINRVLEEEEPKKVILCDDNLERIQIIKEICQRKQIPIQILGKPSRYQELKNLIHLAIADIWRPVRYRRIRRWCKNKQKELNKDHNLKYLNNNLEKGIFLTHPPHWRPTVDPAKGIRNENFHFSLIYDEMKKNSIQVIDMHTVSRIGRSSRVIKEMEDSPQEIPIIFLQTYFSGSSFPYSISSKIIEKQILKFFDNHTFSEKLIYQGLSLHKQVLHTVQRFFRINIPFVLLTINNALQMVLKERPSFIFLINEYSLHERAVIFAAKSKGIPCYAMQHGLISKDSRGYAIKSLQTTVADIELPPRANKTLLYGKGFSEVLLKHGSYSPNEIEIVGSPFWEKVEVFKSQYDPVLTRKRLKLPEKSKIILYTMQNLPDGSNSLVNQLIIDTFLNLGRKDFFLLIKVHPVDNIENYFHLIPPHRSDIGIIKDEALGEMLSISSVLITAYSTTVFDAAIMSIPSITVTASHSIINSFFYDSNISFNADNSNLGTLLLRILEKEDNDAFNEQRERIKNKYAAGLDLKSLNRIWSIIQESLNKKSDGSL